MVEHGDQRVDELRQRLRSLGYLDAGVDRFVLAPARDARRPMTIAWLASLRIGVLAALLMGPAAALGVAARMPGLITGPRDGFVIAAYMGLLFGGAVALAAFLAGIGASWGTRLGRTRDDRTRRRIAVVAGAVITVASLAYLTLWWDASTLSSGRTGATILALALAAAISLLLGHLVTVAALAITVSRHGTADGTRGVPGASRRVVAAAGLLAFCGALLLLNLTDRSSRGIDQAPPLTVVSSGHRIRLLAIDGFDPEIARRLAADGRIPALATMLGGTRAVIQFDDTRDPARAWTTIATGQPAEIHAVRGLETRRVAGVQGTLGGGEPRPLARVLAAATDLVRLTRPAIASGTERRVKTMWEVAAGAGLSTVVVNWWATWPAPPDTGVVVTDRATLRLERGGELDAEISPATVYERLRTAWPAIREWAGKESSSIEGASDMDRLLRRSAELDSLQLGITREAGGRDADLTMTYLPGLDLVQHGLLTPANGGAPAPSAVAARLGALESYYVFLDGLLADSLRPGERGLVMLLTSPGRVQASTPGILAVRGSVVNERAQDAVARAVDVVPTVMHALGLPISEQLAGRALIELFSAEFARRYPVRVVRTYGAPAMTQSPRTGQPLDQEMIDRLRSLGYVR
jgi:hypothetical protein